MIDDIEEMMEIDKIIAGHPNPEDINTDPQKAPSKRMEKIFRDDKGSDAELIISKLDMHDILANAPGLPPG